MCMLFFKMVLESKRKKLMMANCIVISIKHLSRRLKYNFDIMATSLKKKTHIHIYISYKFLCTKPRRTICLYIPFHGKLCKIVNIHSLCKVLLQNCYFHQHTSCLYRCMILWIMIYCILA